MPTTQHLAYIAGGSAILVGSIVMYAPDTFPYLWCFKAATFAFSQIALGLLNPDKVLSTLPVPKP